MNAIRHGYAKVNGLRLHYAESGSGDQLVLLLHGFPEFWFSWRHQLDALGKHFHVVAPDMRGYNLSDKPGRVEDYQVDVIVNDVIGLIDHFGAARAAVVGHDWGATVAWAVAQQHPDRVSKLAVMQVPPAAVWRANMSARQVLRSWYMFLFQLPRLPEWMISRRNMAAIDRTFTDSVIRKGSFSAAEIKIYKEALRQPGALTSAVNYYRANISRLASRGSKSTSSSEKTLVPTLFIFAEQDFAILPETVRGVADHVDGPFRELRIKDSGHWVQNEAAEEVNNALIEFLSGETAQQTDD
ncbi:MAG TPA: alpha/beta hydrolase [Pyrinomonadaceae bacterium]|nr:alpha/beta hydrolase [Pyrinomonadaceae bacterium]